jgi:hypothetical protein
MSEHVLKIWPRFFDAVMSGALSGCPRRADRDFTVGDLVTLREFDPEGSEYTGRVCTRQITYVLPGGQFGLAPDYVGLSLAPSHPEREACIHDPGNTWFDRELCAEPCGAMHQRCRDCGRPTDQCHWEAS